MIRPSNGSARNTSPCQIPLGPPSCFSWWFSLANFNPAVSGLKLSVLFPVLVEQVHDLLQLALRDVGARNLRAVQAHLRHSDIQTTTVYGTLD